MRAGEVQSNEHRRPEAGSAEVENVDYYREWPNHIMTVIADIEQEQAELSALRRDIHAHPELAYTETRTAALVAEQLEQFGIEVHRGLGKTGVVGVLRGNGAGNTRSPSE